MNSAALQPRIRPVAVHTAVPSGDDYSIWKLGFVLSHIPLAMVLNALPAVATVHAIVTFGLGMVWASSGTRLERVFYVCGYFMGAEVLWRMCGASLLWEFGKYGVSFVLVIALVRRGRNKPPLPAILYLLFMLPSVITTFTELSFFLARRDISFNLSGPISLFVSIWFFHGLRIRRKHIIPFFMYALAPIVGILTISLYTTHSVDTIQFTNESNFITSGGFGPNQVSSMLGLGALLMFLVYVLCPIRYRMLRLGFMTMILALAVQSVLTFSRGGIFMAVLSGCVGYLFLMRDRQIRERVMSSVVIIALTVLCSILPYLIDFTRGMITVRYTDVKSAGRLEIMAADLRIWLERPVFGVGVGQAPAYRLKHRARTAAAHTEFSRLLAEHGIPGAGAILMLCVLGCRAVLRRRDNRQKAFVMMLMTWSWLYMFINAMRLLAPSVMFGLATAVLLIDDDEQAR